MKRIFLLFTLIGLWGFSSPLYAQNNQFSVLAYHSVIDETDKQRENDYFPQTLSSDMLIQHFNWLKSQGYNVISWQQILEAEKNGKPLPDKAVLLTFDDGYRNMYNVIYPLLKAYHYAAVFAPVTAWINTPAGQKIHYGNQLLDRQAFVTWEQIVEMQQSGLVEIASHSHNLHQGVVANPGGSLLPAAIAPRYFSSTQQYESKAQYNQRIYQDLKASATAIKQHTGKSPSVVVWPYGRFTEAAVSAAEKAGMGYHFSLNDQKINQIGDHHIGRLLLDAETDIATIEAYLQHTPQKPKPKRVIHVDLDYVYDKDPQVQQRNFDRLIQRIYDFGITTVYLQAFADSDGNGVAEALYFPNAYLPVKADLFSQVAWQLISRAGVEVYAWLPVLAFDLGRSYEYVQDEILGTVSQEHYLRLSPYNPTNLQAIKSIYADLAFYAKFNGILFHDDAFLTDREYRQKSYQQKTADLIQVTQQLKTALGHYFMAGKEAVKTARNLYASVITQPEAEQWFAQSLNAFEQAYDTTAIMAMPYMENPEAINPKQAQTWLASLIQLVKQQSPDSSRLLFELQAVNWRTKTAISEEELIRWIGLLESQGFYNVGYYPDNFILNQPRLEKLKPYFSVDSDPYR